MCSWRSVTSDDSTYCRRMLPSVWTYPTGRRLLPSSKRYHRYWTSLPKQPFSTYRESGSPQDFGSISRAAVKRRKLIVQRGGSSHVARERITFTTEDAMRGQGRIFRPKVGGRESQVWWLDYSIRTKRHRESSRTTSKREALDLLRERIGKRKDGTLTDDRSA